MESASLRQDARVIGLVGLAHGVSHFFHLIVAGLFPWLKTAFSLSYAQLGLLMTVFFIISGVGQALSGFIVDRVGARLVHFSGVALLGVSALILAGANSYAMLMIGSIVAGCGNAVFHPAGYTILNQRVSKPRLGHAYSVHGISGSLGWAAAPAFLASVALMSGWRHALLAAAVIPFAVLILLIINRDALRPDPPAVKSVTVQQEGSFAFLRLPAVWMCFAFFFLSSVALGGIQSFASTSLVALYGVSLATATTAYTTFMLCSAGGMFAGGFLASRSSNPDRTVAVCFAAAALIALLLAAAMVPAGLVLVLMGAIGFASGVAGPSRDLLIRAAAPPNASGRVFGVVYSGMDSGMACGPLLFGAMLDGGHPSWVFICIALFQALAIMTAFGAGNSRAPVLQKA
jgi:FSR family fosmidomycin resistance protein-like MFS transporter